MSDQPLPPTTTLLIKGGRALLPSEDWNQPRRVDIAIAGARIVGIAPAYAASGRAVETIDARDSLVLPGFVKPP